MHTVRLPNGVHIECGVDADVHLSEIADLTITEVCDALSKVLPESGSLNILTPLAEDALGIPPEPLRLRLPELRSREDIIIIHVDEGDILCGVEYPVAMTAEALHEVLSEGADRRKLTVKSVEIWTGSNDESVSVTLSAPRGMAIRDIALECHYMMARLRGTLMEVDSPRSALRVIQLGSWSMFLGKAENHWLEAKASMYGLDDARQCFELGLDVASMANSPVGGIIVIGFSTTKDALGRDIISEVAGNARLGGSVPRIEAVIQQRAFPHPEALVIDVFRHKGRDVLAILIPPQPEQARPFLVSGSEITSGKVYGQGFTWVERRGSSKRAVSVTEIQRRLNSSLNRESGPHAPS